MIRRLLFVLVALLGAGALADAPLGIESLVQKESAITGIEVIVATASRQGIAGHFGHVLIRFVDQDPNWSDNLTANFIADVDSDKINNLKGLTGGYPMSLQFFHLGDAYMEYLANEGRAFSRFIVPVNRDEIHRLIQILAQWSENPALMKNYSFLGNNCATATERLLQQAGISQKVSHVMEPLNMGDWLEQSLLSPFPTVEVQNPFFAMGKAVQILGLKQKEDLLLGRNWPANAADLLLAQLSDSEIKFLVTQLTLMPGAVVQALTAKRSYRWGGADPDQVMNFQKFESSYYSLCQDAKCISDLNKTMNSHWTSVQLEHKRHQLRFVLDNLSDEASTKEEGDSQPFNLLKTIDPVRAEVYQNLIQLGD